MIAYKLIRSKRKTLGLQVTADGAIMVRAPQKISKREVAEFVSSHEAWINKQLSKIKKRQEEMVGLEPFSEAELKNLTAQAKAIIPERVAYYARKLGVSYGRITIRHQKTRWGSCVKSSGNLSFNCLLMLAPMEAIDSVVVHELCHRLEMNHSAKFYEHVLRIYPEYRTWNKWLKENGRFLMGRLP